MRRLTFTILLMSAFSAMMGLGIISPFLPEFVREHGANGFWIGMIFAGFGISRGIIMPIAGRYSDKFGRKIFVSSGLFLFTLISLAYPLADNMLQMTLVRMAHGLAAGMIIPMVMAYAGELAEKGKEGATTGLLNMMFYLGLASGPFIGGYVSKNYGFDTVFHIMSFLGAFTFFVVLFLLPDSRRDDNTFSEDNEIYSFNSLIKYNFIKAVLISALIITLTVAVFMSFLPSLAEKVNVDPDHIGIIISVGIFLAGILQVPFGKIADKHDPIAKLIQAGLGASIGMMALFAMPFCPDFNALIIAGGFVGIGSAIATPALSGVSVDIGKRTGMGRWMGIFNSAMSVGFVLTPILAGVIMDHMGIDSVFYVFGLLALFGGSVFIYVLHKRALGFKTG